jgi:hypothetical protein
MATSSSAKKVARVAAKSGSGRQTGGSTPTSKNWLFAVAIVAIVGLGIGIVAFARNENAGAPPNDAPPMANLNDGKPYDHWHAAMAIDVCGKELPPLQDGPADVLGIHTHGDGLAHVHPFSTRASGSRATLQRFWDQTSLKVTNSGFKLPAGMTVEGGGNVVKEGQTTCGGKPGELVLAHWKQAVTAASTKPDKIYTKDFGKVRFTEDLGAFTLAYVAKGDRDIPAPSSAAKINELITDVPGGTTGSTPVTGTPATEVPTTAATATTAASGETTATTKASSG